MLAREGKSWTAWPHCDLPFGVDLNSVEIIRANCSSAQVLAGQGKGGRATSAGKAENPKLRTKTKCQKGKRKERERTKTGSRRGVNDQERPGDLCDFVAISRAI